MADKLPTIAILGGTGKEGPGLAMRWAVLGYPILIGSRQTEKAQETASKLNEQLGLTSIQGMQNNNAAQHADISVLTVVFSAHESAVLSLKEALQGKILVDTTARVDFRDPKPPKHPAAARHAQNVLGPGVKVVAAFQTVPFHILRKNLGEQLDTDVLVCSDDLEAAKMVMKLSEAAGMPAYYAGNLDNAVVVEGLTAIMISMNSHYKVKTASIGIHGINQE
ncbi:MAG: NADPH-dependent F420 reductase [Anaerolineales bacterium]|nr:MAG: NADPH-dependent F420 reductase [Anaerolineales bacterium]